MAYSMTGYGAGEVQLDDNYITVELKTVNNRYMEVSCRLPSFLSQFEGKVREIVRSHIQRGKLYLNVSIQGNTNGALGIHIEQEAAESVGKLLQNLRDITGVKEELKLDHFLKFSEIFENKQEMDEGDKIWPGVEDALKQALQDLKNMRAEEGRALCEDMVKRVKKINEHVDVIEKMSKDKVEETYQRLVEKVRQLVRDADIHVDRVEAEVALIAEKLDVTEECVRLRSHDQLFLNVIEKESVVGKKLNFLLQEMNREANTISSKASHADISHLVVDMKEEIEKLREQVQNLE